MKRAGVGSKLVSSEKSTLESSSRRQAFEAKPNEVTKPNTSMLLKWLPGGRSQGRLCLCHRPGLCGPHLCHCGRWLGSLASWGLVRACDTAGKWLVLYLSQ